MTPTEEFLANGIWLEEMILRGGIEAREHSKTGYKPELLDARLTLLAVAARLLRAKNGVAGDTDADRSHRILLVLAFFQGVYPTEATISEAQYIKAAALLKQDYEILARIREIRAGQAKIGQTPQVKHAPEGSQRFYGQLNGVAHPSNPQYIEQLLECNARGDAVGPSFVPRYNRETANNLYELHVWLILEITRELLLLFVEFYGQDDPAVRQALLEFMLPVDLVTRAGFSVSS
jgi:hypothetical protein